MAQFSFDIESTFNKPEMNNVHQLVVREIANRFDFKGTPADWAAIPATVQPVFVAGKAPPIPEALFEKEVFFRANSSNSGIIDTSALPPLAFEARVFSIDSR